LSDYLLMHMLLLLCDCSRERLAEDDCHSVDWLCWSQLLCCSATVTGGI